MLDGQRTALEKIFDHSGGNRSYRGDEAEGQSHCLAEMYERHKRRCAGRAAALGTEAHRLCPQFSDLSVNLFKFTGSEKRGRHGDYHTVELGRDGIISLIRCK